MRSGWTAAAASAASGGPWLFGEYTIADAMYAPVVLRFNTYRAQISDTARWYMATALEDAALQEWVRAAQEEPWTNPDYEDRLSSSRRTRLPRRP